MAKIFHEFKVVVTEVPDEPAGCTVTVNDPAIVGEFAEMGIRPDLLGKYTYIEISLAEESIALAAVYASLEKRGYFPIPPGDIRRSGGQLFHVRRARKYSHTDLDLAPLLRIDRPSRLLGAEFDSLLEDGTPVIESEGRGHFGSLSWQYSYGFSELLKAKLMATGLRGLSFRRILKKSGNSLIDSSYWQLVSGITMPPCQLRRLNDGYHVVQGDFKGSAYWYDDGYVPQELRFDAVEVAELGDFDVAQTRERVGPHKNDAHHNIIVSQRFRQVWESYKVRGMEFVPVVLT